MTGARALGRWALVASLALAGCGTDPEPLRPGERDPWVCDEDAPAVGVTPLRRLTREQYQNTVQDVFGVEGRFGELLAEDEQVGSFATNLSVPVDRAALEAYLQAADAVVDAIDVAAIDDCDRLVEAPADCALRFIRAYGRLLYRRPLDLQDENRLFGIYETHGATDHRAGLRMVLRTMLVSPSFLYHDDFSVAGPPAAGMQALGPYAVADRLAFFLWNSAPDGALLDAARDGRLDTAEGIREEAERMLADPRAARGIGAFHRAWLHIGELPEDSRDPTLYPTFDPTLAEAMIEETERFAEYVIRHGDGSLRTLLTANWSIVPAELHAHYGLPEGTPTDAPVELDPSRRAGIFTHASFLTAGAHHQTSSLTLRGKVIREDVLCHELPDPPDGVDITVPAPAPGATTRQRFEAHRESETCATCHELIDPIGFAFESFDAIGRWRDLDQGIPVDTRGALTGTDVDREVGGAVELAHALGESRVVRQCVARQWFRFALGRRETDEDGCSLAAIDAAMDAPDDLRQLLLAIVVSDSFRHRPAAGE